MAEHVEFLKRVRAIEVAEGNIKSDKEKLLRDSGWRYSSRYADCYWRWSKTIEGEQITTMDVDEALKQIRRRGLMGSENLAQWQVDANRWRFIRGRAEKLAAFAARSPCLSFEKYLEFAEKELTKAVRWEEMPHYYETPYGADGVCPEDWNEFYQAERDIGQKMLSMGQAEYDSWAKTREVEDSEAREYRARRNREVDYSLQHHRNQVRRHAGRTTKQQKEHERSGNYPW